tara:strand:- start:816 stop:1118 length:303 start_codon:yes stop_codon:yes gene_type:complete
MITSLKEIAELMRSDLFQLDEDTEQDLLNASVISKDVEYLLNDLEDAILLIEKLKKADLFITKPVAKKSKYISCRLCGYSSTDERAFNYANNDIICHHCN